MVLVKQLKTTTYERDTMENTDAKKACDEAKADIANLLGWFECELAKDPPAPTWSRAGSLESTRSWLIDALSVLSDHSPEAITDSLAESRIDTQTQA